MHHHLLAVVVPDPAQPLQMRKHEAPEKVFAHERPGLAAEIVSDEKDVA
jgi:hypothetical protein